MKYSSSILYTIASSLLASSTVSADCNYVAGNYYCSETNGISYSGIGFAGSYQDVTNMDESSCQCTQSSKSFSGSMAPLDEELSVHFRGPIKLVQFGVYYPSSSNLAKRDQIEEEDCTTTRHVHHKHKRAPAVEIVEVTTTVFQDAAGNVQTITPDSSDIEETTTSSPPTTLLTQTTGATTSAEAGVTSTSPESSSSSSSSTTSSSSAKSTSTSSPSSSGDWTRSAYYTPGQADGLVFMNNQGGAAGSGTWSSCFGNSISYCAADGVSGASSAQVLNEVTVSSNTEFMIFSDSSCSSSGDCGYYRSDIPAYQGFSGADKIFVFEFQMPTASSSDSSSSNYDMPAVWLLNAKIPRTLQYGDSSCSCWSTGCGEMDLFEILSSGSDKLISHLHDGQGSAGSAYGGAGSQDYFARPTDSTMKAAAIFQDSSISVIVLDDSTDFGSSLSSSTVSEWLDISSSVAALV